MCLKQILNFNPLFLLKTEKYVKNVVIFYTFVKNNNDNNDKGRQLLNISVKRSANFVITGYSV